MKIYRAKDYNDMSRKAANLISAQIIMKPNCVLGLATGSSPVGTYRQLVEWYEKGDLDFSEVITVNLDEYKGLTRDNSQSYYYFMNENLFSKVNINKNKTFLPDGTEPDRAWLWNPNFSILFCIFYSLVPAISVSSMFPLYGYLICASLSIPYISSIFRYPDKISASLSYCFSLKSL